MKRLILFFLILVSLKSFAQTVIKTKKISRKVFHILGEDFEGVLFTDKYIDTDIANHKRFTPNIKEIELAETCIRQSLDTVVSIEAYRYSGKTAYASYEGNRVAGNLKYYVRQYYGYINQKGEKVLLVNCFYRSNNVYLDKKDWQTQLVFVYDGGKAFWRVKVNLDAQKLFELRINGI